MLFEICVSWVAVSLVVVWGQFINRSAAATASAARPRPAASHTRLGSDLVDGRARFGVATGPW